MISRIPTVVLLALALLWASTAHGQFPPGGPGQGGFPGMGGPPMGGPWQMGPSMGGGMPSMGGGMPSMGGGMPSMGGGMPGMGTMPGMGGSGRSGWGGRGGRGGGGGDRFSRMEGFLRRMDTNGDGVIREDEVPEERRFMLRGMSMRLGLDPAKGVSIDKLRETLGSRGGQPGSTPTPGAPSPDAAKDKAKQEPPLVPGFGIDRETVAVAGFGTRVQPVTRVVLGAEGNVDPQIRALFGRVDRNGNGLLDRDEWTSLPGNLGQFDTNQDGRITLAEVGSRMAERQRQRQQSPSWGPGGFAGGGFPGGGFGNRASDEDEENDENESAKAEKRPKSYRFRSARELLPEGLPGWFVERDADADGQVAMAEFARRWDNSTIREYFEYDGNRDGLITPEECLHSGDGASGKEVSTGEMTTPTQSPSGEKKKGWWQ